MGSFIKSVVDSEAFGIALCLLSAFPIALLFNRTNKYQQTLRHLLSIVTSFLLFLLAFNWKKWLDMFSATLYVWLVTRYLPRTIYSPIICFVLLMSHMSYVHLSAQFWYVDSPNFVDASSTMMVLVMKLSSFAWSYYDGSKPSEDLSQDQKLYAIFKHRILA
jgi:lysophospholipid acyltransferase